MTVPCRLLLASSVCFIMSRSIMLLYNLLYILASLLELVYQWCNKTINLARDNYSH